MYLLSISLLRKILFVIFLDWYWDISSLEKEELKLLKDGILQDSVEEYSDEICITENGYVYSSTLYIASSDYNVMVITKNKITDELLK